MVENQLLLELTGESSCDLIKENTWKAGVYYVITGSG